MCLLESERAVISTEEFSYSCDRVDKKERKREIFIFILSFSSHQTFHSFDDFLKLFQKLNDQFHHLLAPNFVQFSV